MHGERYGQLISKRESPKINKNHHRQKIFRLGISFGRNDLNLEGHLQMGYNSKTIKNYKTVENMDALEPNDSETNKIVQNDSNSSETLEA